MACGTERGLWSILKADRSAAMLETGWVIAVTAHVFALSLLTVFMFCYDLMFCLQHMGLKHGTGIQMFGCQQSYTGDWKGGMVFQWLESMETGNAIVMAISRQQQINGEGTYSQGREGWALTGRFKDCRPVGRCKIVKNG